MSTFQIQPDGSLKLIKKGDTFEDMVIDTKPSPELPLTYKLTAEGSSLWRSTESTDKYYRKWFTKLASLEYSKSLGPGQTVLIVNENGTWLGNAKTVKVLEGP